MMLKLSKLLLNISTILRSKSTYYEMKFHLDKAINSDQDVVWLKPIYPYMRNIGKSYSLVKLSLKYNIPIIIPMRANGYHLYHIALRYFKSDKLQVDIINSSSRGRRYDIVLVEEGFSSEELKENVYPICNKVIGYKNI